MALVLAFLIASTALYWLPFLQRLLGPHGSHSGYDLGYYGTGVTYDFYEYTPAADALKAAAAEVERSALNTIHDELEKETTVDLNKAKAFRDVCATSMVDCRGLPDAKVRPFIDAVLADRQTALAHGALSASQGANLIAFGSMVVAIFALLFGIFKRS